MRRTSRNGVVPLAASVRESATRGAGAEVMDVCEFELALAHLRVPELA